MFDPRLLPKEHGAYAQLAFPLLSGLLAGGPTWAGAGIAVAAMLLFLAAEPLEVLIGARGGRALETLGGAARAQLAWLAALGAGAGIGALALAAPAARMLALVPAALGAVLVPLVFARRLKTLPGEVLVVIAFAALHLPIAAAGGAAGALLWGPAAVWAAVFIGATFAVHALKARHKARDPGLVRAAIAIAALAVGGAIAAAVWVPAARGIAFAALPPTIAVLVVALRAVHPRHLKRVGWTLVAANAAALAGFALA